MINQKNRKEVVQKRHYRLRRTLRGTTTRPRLAVFKSVKHIYVQLINDETQTTLASASSMDPEIRKEFKHGGNIDAAKAVGQLMAERAKAKGLELVVFDRGGNIYHGPIW